MLHHFAFYLDGTAVMMTLLLAGVFAAFVYLIGSGAGWGVVFALGAATVGAVYEYVGAVNHPKAANKDMTWSTEALTNTVFFYLGALMICGIALAIAGDYGRLRREERRGEGDRKAAEAKFRADWQLEMIGYENKKRQQDKDDAAGDAPDA